ncbi:Hsp70 family protein [Streptomyces sp. NPDC052016]|uniref:Hsp70 family protein n=1 Tax=Streptomyces sp. NPDC052016 TaxID=3365680 RepID=UPI0037CF6B82
MTTRIGIDFGTANTVVAGWDHTLDRGEPIPLEGLDLLRDGSGGVSQRVIPSLIAFAADGRRRWTGAAVARDAALLDDPAVAVFQSTKSSVTGQSIDIPRSVGGRRISNREAATQFLGDVMAAATLAVGTDDLEIVATAPVEAFDTYRDWLVREVGETAGLSRLRVVDEATAAAVGYSARLRPGDAFMVFDFGAGTLDISVVRVQEPSATGGGAGVRAIAKAGADLGGNHIDALVARHAADATGVPLGDTAAYNRVFRRLLRSAEAAKTTLTRATTAVVEATDPGTGESYRLDLSRGDFEALLRERDVLGRVGRALRKTLDSASAAGYPAAEISQVFLVGGSSLIPAVQELLRWQFAPEVLRLDRPLEAVAAGAAGIAGGYELHDHIQHDYAIRHVNRDTGVYEFEPLVRAGSEYPTPDPIRTLTIKAIRDGQRNLGLAVYELAHATYRDAGADLEIVFDADGGASTVAVTAQHRQEQSQLWLNEDNPTFLEADPPARAGADRFRVDFRIDAHKRLTVSAFDLERRVWVLDRQPIVRLA